MSGSDDHRDFYRHRRVLITGGLGFIGSNLAHALVDLEAEVAIVDALLEDCGGRRGNIAAIASQVAVHVEDIGQPGVMDELVRGREIVFNLAGQTSHVDSLRSALPVFAPPIPMTVGHRYLVAGQVSEFDGISTQIANGLTEGVNTVYQVDEGVAVIPTARLQTVGVLSDSTCDATQSVRTGEDYEGMLVNSDRFSGFTRGVARD